MLRATHVAATALQHLKHTARMWPAKAFCVARDAFREFQTINIPLPHALKKDAGK